MHYHNKNKYINRGLAVLVMLMGAIRLQAQTNTQNYVRTRVPRTPITSGTKLDALTANKDSVQTTIQYIDGTGRPLQTVQVKASPAGMDMVEPFAYDQFGREAAKYLPYVPATNDGSYQADALSSGAGQASFYGPSGNAGSGSQQTNGIVVNTFPYALSKFESSPLNRVTEQGAPGAAWQPAANDLSGHTVKMVYKVNNTAAVTDTANTLFVALYTATINTDGTHTLVHGTGTDAYYGAGQLFVTISKDENWKSGRGGTAEEYKDKEGKVVLKRTFNYIAGTLQILSTYYVYDDLGKLAFVLPPLAGGDMMAPGAVPGQPVRDNLCYQYNYDERGRLFQKKLPGKGWEYLVYNKLDQPVLSQDGNQRATNQWTVSKYDALGRVIMTGLWNADAVIPQTTLQTRIYGNAQWDVRNYSDNITGYTASSYPALSKILSTNYYDDYRNIPLIPASFMISGNSTMTRGLPTASKAAVLNTLSNATPDMLWNAHYYDDKGRGTQSFQQHYLGGSLNAANYDQDTVTYNFNDQVTTTTRQHYAVTGAAGLKLTVSSRYIYDHMGRKLKTWQQIKNAGQLADTKVLLSKLVYNEIGQLLTKNLHSTDSTTFKQSIRYTYNERGWLTSNTSDLFAMYLYYNDGTVPQYNGNVTNQFWQAKGGAVTIYTYLYDQLNRLTLGNSTEGNNENGITYDLGGNITALNRYTTKNLTPVDQLSYTYTTGGNYTNQLQSITDASTNDTGLKHGTWAYGYDANGNMTSDASKGIGTNGITYNLLNLPQAIGAKNTTYSYDAAGQKLRRVILTNTTDYVSGIQYDGLTTGTPTLTFIQTEEGRALANGAANYNYEYTLTDHLGNSRVSFDAGNPTVAKQVDDYYPFGMEISQGTIPSPKNEYLYNNKELQENLGLYDYGARFYDPVIGRWTSVDPEVEKYEKWSPYNYVLNNPISNTDPKGDTVRFAKNSSFEFRLNYLLARIYLKDNGADQEVSRLEGSTSVYTITETGETNGTFRPNVDKNGEPLPGGAIAWNTTLGFKTNLGEYVSPVEILNHEFDHAASYDKNPVAHMTRRKIKNADYGNEEEKRVITGSEQFTAQMLGTVGGENRTRVDHGYRTLLTAPNIFDAKNGTPRPYTFSMQEIEITAPRIKKVNPNKP